MFSNTILVKTTLLCLLLSFCCLTISAQNIFQHQSTCKKANILIQQLEKYHLQPLQLNEKVAAEIFDDLIKALDPKGLYFTQTDLQPIQSHRTQWPAAIKSQNCTFLEELTAIYQLKLRYADTLIKFHTRQSFSFTDKDELNYKSIDDEEKSLMLEKNDLELNRKWRLYLKYQTLRAMFKPSAKQNDVLQKDAKTILAAEQQYREKVRKLNIRQTKNILDYKSGLTSYVSKHFLNAIANRFDPHTVYFTPEEREDFVSMISKDGKSFGFKIDENKNGEIEIISLAPGGSAWKTNEVNVNDIVISMKFDNAETLDFTFMDRDEIVAAISGNMYAKQLELTIRKANGQIKTVTLQSEKTEQEDNIVKSYILDGQKKIGYISLPSFYDEWEGLYPLGCGNDVAIEISKLQEDKLEGLILDLRFNGGGSMKEAINLSGIFIHEGPVSILKDKSEKAILLKDMNRGTAYNGPLVVLVNGQSASASEMVSAALQDYNRAVIVGSTTYGKGTSQATYPLDINYEPDMPVPTDHQNGYVNITQHKFYRISKNSHQNKGVQPDIILPDFSIYGDHNEASNKYAIPSDAVVKNVYYTPLAALPISTLAEKSKQRVQKNALFQEIQNVNDSLRQIDKETQQLLLQTEPYRQLQKRYAALETSIKQLSSQPSKAYKVINNSHDTQLVHLNDIATKMNDSALQKIQSDIYIEEAFFIIQDLIQQP